MDNKILAQADVHIFNEVYQIRNEQGRVLDFHEHGFLWDIFSDFTPHQAIRKAAQIGFSTTAIIKSLWLAKSKKMDIIYTLPTYGDVHDFVTSKTNRIIEQNPIMKSWIPQTDWTKIESKHVGDSVIHYRGTWSERAALMITSDLNVHDEVDRSNLNVVGQYYSRLQHSKYAWQWLFSNPSVPDQGVDKLWNQSDQKHWFIKCEHCNQYQYLTMSNVMQVDGVWDIVCNKCHKHIERTKGQWVKRFEDRQVSGYWISLLMAPWVSAERIKQLEADKSPEYFANFVLGTPYVGGGNAVTRDMIMRNLTNSVNPMDGRIVIGVDTGADTRYVVGNERGIFYYGECKGYEELELLLKRWDRAVMVIDQGGDIVRPRELRDKYWGRIYLAHYRSDTTGEELFDWDDEEVKVTIDRNRAIQLLVDEFADSRIPIFGNETDWNDYWLHWNHIYRVAEETSLGTTRYKWNRSDRDDWVHATVYWRAGIDRFMAGQGAIIDITGTSFQRGYTDLSGKALFTATRSY